MYVYIYTYICIFIYIYIYIYGRGGGGAPTTQATHTPMRLPTISLGTPRTLSIFLLRGPNGGAFSYTQGTPVEKLS